MKLLLLSVCALAAFVAAKKKHHHHHHSKLHAMTSTASCESYAERHVNAGWPTAKHNPCWGYSNYCCDGEAGDYCYWRDSDYCDECASDGSMSCPGCCESFDLDTSVEVTEEPSAEPSESPSNDPSASPSEEPSVSPTENPTDKPTKAPTEDPSRSPTEDPTPSPTEKPTMAPSDEPTESPSDDPTASPSKEPSEQPTPSPTKKPTKNPTVNPTNKPTSEPSSKPTENPSVEPTESPVTPSPTMHSAKKWEMMHPSYKGGDGELLWNVYYGDFSNDERFDAFRRDQLWDADVIRPIIEMDAKFERFQFNQAASVGHESKFQVADYKWLIVAVALMAVMAAYSVWKKRSPKFINIDEQESTQPLINYQAAS